MNDLEKQIANANAYDLDVIMHALMRRHKTLYPDWELTIVSLPKTPQRNEMIDQSINLLQQLKDE